MNPHDQLTRLTRPQQDERITRIISREGGTRLPATMTVQCCGLTFTGSNADALKWSVEHRREHHPKPARKHPARSVVDQIGRENGTKESARIRKEGK